MRIHKLTKKGIALGTLGAVAVAAIAVAYFTTTGSGTGNAEVGTSTAITITGTVPTVLYPGTSSEVSFKAKNPSKGHQFVGTVSLTSVKAYEDQGHEHEIAGCLSSWFKMNPVAAEQDLAGETETTLTSKGTLEFLNKPESQNACKSAYLVATFTSN